MFTKDWPMPAVGLLWLAWFVYWELAALFTNKTKSAEGRVGRLQYMLPMEAGFLLIFHGARNAIFDRRVYQMMWLRAIGVTITLAGLLFTVWARVHLFRPAPIA